MLLADFDGGMNWIVSMAIFVPLTLVVLLGMLRPVKGMTLAIMLKNNMLRPVAAATNVKSADRSSVRNG